MAPGNSLPIPALGPCPPQCICQRFAQVDTVPPIIHCISNNECPLQNNRALGIMQLGVATLRGNHAVRRSNTERESCS